MRIGDLYIELGLLNQTQVDQILNHSKQTGYRFDEAAIDLNLLNHDQLIRLFGHNHTVDFFDLNEFRLPQNLIQTLPLSLVIPYGVIPIGWEKSGSFFDQRKNLKVGILNPSRKDAVDAIQSYLQRSEKNSLPSEIKLFLVSPKAFIEKLQNSYGVNPTDVMKQAQIDPTLKNAFEEFFFQGEVKNSFSRKAS